MIFSDASICNLALSRIGVTNTIDSIDDDTAEARACKALYDHVRETLLASHPWGFATRRADLALLSDDSADSSTVGGWGYTYSLPANCVQVLRVWGGDRIPLSMHKVPYALEYDATSGKVLRTDMSATDTNPVQIEYIFEVDNPTLFPPWFRDAFAWALAAELAMALSVDDGRAVRARQMAEQMLSRAMAASANEGSEVTPDSEIIAAREQVWSYPWQR